MKISQAIVLSAGPNGLGALRSLTREKVITDVIVTNAREPVLYSRLYNQAKIIELGKDSQALLDALLSWPNGGQVLIPTSDWFVDFLVSNEKVLKEKFYFVLPHGDLSQQFIDKQKEIELVKDLVNLPQSITHLPISADLLKSLLPLPLIIKPRSNELNQLGKKNIVIRTDEELDSFYQTYSHVLEFCIAQELVEGGDDNLWVCNCVFDYQGQLINAFTFQRLQLTPPHFGVTCYAESIENKEVLKQVAKLGQGLAYIGPAMVEFKYDENDGLYKYIEVNPRIGLCNYFDTSCGRNNVFATYCLALDLPFQQTQNQKHRMFVSLYEDLYSRYRDKQSILFILKTYMHNIFKPHTFIYFAWRDPWPSIVVGAQQLTKMLEALVNKLKRK